MNTIYKMRISMNNTLANFLMKNGNKRDKENVKTFLDRNYLVVSINEAASLIKLIDENPSHNFYFRMEITNVKK